jgi:hypothetical protein
MDKSQIKELIGKLRRPIHISYISKYITKLSIDETKKELDVLISEGLIKESEMADGYYVVV